MNPEAQTPSASDPRSATLGHRAAAALAAWIHRRAGTILIVTGVLLVLALVFASRLRIDQELRRLLPNDFPSVQRLERLSSRLGQQSDLYVTIRSPSREANIAFGEKLTEALEEREDLRFVQFRRDLEFFEKHALLYASLADVVDLRRRVIHRIREEVRKKAFGDFGDGHEAEPAADAKASADALGVDIEGMRRSYGLQETSQEFMEADEGRLMVVKIRPDRPSTDLEFARSLSAQVLSLAESLDPSAYHVEMQIDLEGAYVQHTGRVRTLQDEVVGGSISAALALLVTLGIYFRSTRGVVLVFVPLLASVVGALAYAWLRFEVLNLVSAFIFAVLLGLGIDHGIHVLSRLRQERGAGREPQEALTHTLATSGWTTLAGSVSTAAAFAALMVADFQGFAQFGQVAAVGVVLSVIAALVVMPALTVVMDRVLPWVTPPQRSAQTHAGARGLPRWLSGAAVVFTILGLGAAAVAILRLPELQFEHDLKQLGPRREAADNPQAGYRDAVGRGQTVDPVIALVETQAQVDALQAQLTALRAMTVEEVANFDPRAWPTRPLPEPPIDPLAAGEDDEDDEFGDEDLEDPKFVALEALAVREAVMSPETAALLGRYGPERLVTMRDRLQGSWSLAAFVPRHQEAKLEVIADIRTRIQDKYGMLTPQTRAEVDAWMHYLEVEKPVTRADLPAWVRSQFETLDGTVGGFLVIATHGSKADVNNARRIYEAFWTLETAADRVDTAAEFYVIPEIFETVLHDGPRVMALALGIMLMAAWVLLRRVGAAFAVALTLGLALAWMAGVMLWLDWRLNFFNIIVVPLLLGMGEDDALHWIERDREESGEVRRILVGAGGPIFMTTLTTIWGFAGILFANHRGLESMAWMAVLGMSLALVASVVVLPVLLAVGRSLRARLDAWLHPRR